MISKFLIAAFFALSLAGCAGQKYAVYDRPTIDEIKANPKKAMTDQIVNFNAVLTAAARSLKANQAIWSDVDYQKYKSYLKESARYSDRAYEYAELGDIVSAEGQMKLADKALAIVQKELIKLKNKESN